MKTIYICSWSCQVWGLTCSDFFLFYPQGHFAPAFTRLGLSLRASLLTLPLCSDMQFKIAGPKVNLFAYNSIVYPKGGTIFSQKSVTVEKNSTFAAVCSSFFDKKLTVVEG